jgi:hypothetical protein
MRGHKAIIIAVSKLAVTPDRILNPIITLNPEPGSKIGTNVFIALLIVEFASISVLKLAAAEPTVPAVDSPTPTIPTIV